MILGGGDEKGEVMTELTGNETVEELVEIIEDLDDKLETLQNKVDKLTPSWGQDIDTMETRLEEAAELAVSAGLAHPTPAGKARWIREGR